MTQFLISVFLISVVSIVIYLNRITKRVIIQPIKNDGTILSAKVVSKTRLDAVKSDYGFVIGLGVGLIAGILMGVTL